MEVVIFFFFCLADQVCLTHIINTRSIKTRAYEMISCKIAKTTQVINALIHLMSDKTLWINLN